MNLKEFIKKYGNKKEIKKGEYLFKNTFNDKNLYYITEGEIILTIFGQNIALVGKNEIIGEKSFIEKTPKPIDAIARDKTTIVYISPENFEKIPDSEKIGLLKQLVLAVSERVYLLNDIISNLSKINQKVSTQNINLSLEYFKNIFKEILDVKNAFIYKFIQDSIIPIYESKISLKLQEEIKKFKDKQDFIKQIKDKVIIKVGDYIMIFQGNKLKSDYIINNIFIHSLNTLKYLCLLLEEKKNLELENILDEDF